MEEKPKGRWSLVNLKLYDILKIQHREKCTRPISTERPRGCVCVFSFPFPIHTHVEMNNDNEVKIIISIISVHVIHAHTHTPRGHSMEIEVKNDYEVNSSNSIIIINKYNSCTHIYHGQPFAIGLVHLFTYVHFYVKFYVLLLLLHRLQYLGTSTIPPTTRSSPTEMFFSFHLNLNLRLSFHLQPVPNCKRPNVEWPISEWLIVERPASISPTVECTWHSSVLSQGKMVASLLHNQRHTQSYQTHQLVTRSTQWPK